MASSIDVIAHSLGRVLLAGGADGTDGSFQAGMHSDHSVSGAALTTETNFDPDGTQR
jgi:hypothetical protein